MIPVVTRARWGFPGWAGDVHGVPMTERTAFVVHWDGAHPVRDTGAAVLQRIDREHRARGWAGIGYNHVVQGDGRVWEGRGWGFVGAHCPGMNRVGIGVQVAVGTGQHPTSAALAALAGLYGEACERAGRALQLTTHAAHYATECPGPDLTGWVRVFDGRPDRPAAGRGVDAMVATEAERDELADVVADAVAGRPVPTGELGSDGQPLTLEWLLVRTYQAVTRIEGRLAALEARAGRS